jgi:hypothetical protein
MRFGEDESGLGTTDNDSWGSTNAGSAVNDQRTHNGWARLMRARHWSGGRRLRLVAVVAGVAMATGVAGGYIGVASASTSSPEGAPHANVDVARATSTTEVGHSTPGAAGIGGSIASAPGSVACPMIPGATNTTGPGEIVGGATHLFTRTTADGVTIRAYREPPTESCTCGPIANTQTMPSSGSSSGSAASAAPMQPDIGLANPAISLELSSDAAVGQGVLVDPLAVTTDATTGNPTEPIAVISNAFGVLEGAPVWWTAVSVGPDVAMAQMTFADGSTDQMSPVDGVAVLAHQITPAVAAAGEGPYEVRGTLRLLDSAGVVVTTTTFPGPTPVPLPSPLPESHPASAGGASPSTTVPTFGSPITSNGPSMIACPVVIGPAKAVGG